MKRKINRFLILLTCITMILVVTTKEGNAFTRTNSKFNEEIEYIGDGIYCETIIEDISKGDNIVSNAKYTTKSGTKTATASAPNKNWIIANKSSSRNSNVGSATAVGKQYSGSILLQTITRTVSLKCSKNGTLS